MGDGDVTSLDAQDIEHACDYGGAPGDLFAALVTCQFVDTHPSGTKEIHGWMERAEGLRAAQRKRAERGRIAAKGPGTVVYFARLESEPIPTRVKIGFSTNLLRRLDEYRRDHREHLVVIGTIQGGAELEAEIHRRFAADRIGTPKWFNPSEEILSYLREAFRFECNSAGHVTRCDPLPPGHVTGCDRTLPEATPSHTEGEERRGEERISDAGARPPATEKMSAIESHEPTPTPAPRAPTRPPAGWTTRPAPTAAEISSVVTRDIFGIHVVIDTWNKHKAPWLKFCDGLEHEERAALTRLINTSPEHQDLAWYVRWIERTLTAKFLPHMVQGPPTLAWFVEKPERISRLLRGEYDNPPKDKRGNVEPRVEYPKWTGKKEMI